MFRNISILEHYQLYENNENNIPKYRYHRILRISGIYDYSFSINKKCNIYNFLLQTDNQMYILKPIKSIPLYNKQKQ